MSFLVCRRAKAATSRSVRLELEKCNFRLCRLPFHATMDHAHAPYVGIIFCAEQHLNKCPQRLASFLAALAEIRSMGTFASVFSV